MGVETRVLQVVLSLNPGGTERLVHDLVTRLPDVPTALCCLDEPGAWSEGLQERGVAVTALRRSPGFNPGLGRLVADAAREHRANVIHAHQYTPFVYAALARLWSPRIRVVFTEHGRLSDAPPSPKRRLANRLLRWAPAATCAVSQDLKQFMVAEGFPARDVQVVYNGIEVGRAASVSERLAVRRELGVSDDALVVATVARFDPVKDLGSLLRAVATLSGERPVTALLIGDGPERPHLESLATELGVNNAVRFLGHRNDARRWLAGCDAYVNCSTSEGVSLTILEAMAAALPVVVTRVGGTPEVVVDGCGLLVPARDPAALAGALRRIGQDAPLARALGAAARRRVETHFTIERMVGDYARLYRSIAAGGK